MSDPKTSPRPPEMAGEEASTISPTANGADQEAAAVSNDLETLRNRVQMAEEQRTQYLDLLKRTQADFENYQKRSQRELAQERRYAHGPLASDLLPALDNLDRATAAAKQANETGPLVQGVALVQSQLLDILRRHGITRIEAQGQPFDPHLHQAVLQQPSADAAPHTVLQVLEQGFMIHDRVLRPARVVVAAPASNASADAGTQE